MTEETTPPRRPLATFLRGARNDAGDKPATPAAPEPPADAPEPAPLPVDAVPMPTGTEDDATGAGAADPETGDDALAAADGGDGNDDATATDAEAETATDAPADTATADAVETAAPVTVAASAPRAAAPSFLRSTARVPATRAPRWQWLLAAGLGVLLLVQIAVADRARLAADASTRPLVGALCAVLRCTLPPWHEPAAFTMLSREVRPVPGQPGALQVHASFRNDARWAQAWPALQLSLSDADGRVIGSRVFLPQDYLGPDGDLSQRLEPRQSAQIAFRLREPAAATVAFNFEFR